MSQSDLTRLLVVEDDERLARALALNLGLEGFSVETVVSGEAALDALEADPLPFDFVVLDIMLPGVDGLEVCRRVRERGLQIPILFLTAKGSDAERVLGLRTGADDYLTKPFVVEELVLRIQGILRRSEWSGTPSQTGPVVRIGSREVNLETMRSETSAGSVDLTEREAMLIRFFAENEGRVLTRGELLERVWGYSFDTETRTLDTFIHRLRKYFEEDPKKPVHFHTVRGIGYRFTATSEV